MTEKYLKKCKIKVSPIKSVHQINYVLGKHCLRSLKKDAFYIEIRALLMSIIDIYFVKYLRKVHIIWLNKYYILFSV